MKIGVPKETKVHEYRVGLTPESVRDLVAVGHSVLVETQAGDGIGASDEAYSAAGASIVRAATEVFETAELIVKVKEPQIGERAHLRAGQVLFTYLHLAPDHAQTSDLLASGVTAIAYETVTDKAGTLPLLKPMSQVAGRMSIQAGAASLEKSRGGRGILLGGVPGVRPASVVVLGGGVVGFHAAENAIGLGADVTILDRSLQTIERLQTHFGQLAKVLFATKTTISDLITEADLVVGAVLIPGATAPKLIERRELVQMRRGSVLVDVAIDQGGCFESSTPTTHADPTYIVDGVVHYCVANMPGAVARTSTYALNNATLPHVLQLANLGWRQALREDPYLRSGLNIHDGEVTCEPVAVAHNRKFVSAEKALAL
ncbi:alanine dehydrogenase [Mesorhizobium sp. CN2-181]|uniref:alanine dehydrogenase n=1 Tax=Mesorhizobium yinganensis TaxID=3157707 RepID=UPI0032B7A356